MKNFRIIVLLCGLLFAFTADAQVRYYQTYKVRPYRYHTVPYYRITPIQPYRLYYYQPVPYGRYYYYRSYGNYNPYYRW